MQYQFYLCTHERGGIHTNVKDQLNKVTTFTN